ncbi:MAG: Mur ligase family protein [Pirellulaceae bacterium]
MNKIPDSAKLLRGLSLKSILSQATVVGGTDIFFRSCSGTWSDCQPGDLYVAVVEPEIDGHDFANQAVERGAAGIVTERLLAVDCPQFIVNDSRIALGQLCHALAGTPSTKLPVVGVAGSDGKSVTSYLIRQILIEAGMQPSIFSTFNAGTCNAKHPENSAWKSTNLAQWMADSVLENSSHCIVDVENESLASHQLCGTGFDVMVLTNIRRDETGRYCSDESYRQLMARSIEYLKPQGMAIINADDPNSERLLDLIGTPALTFGLKQSAEVTGKIVSRSTNETTFVISAGCESAVINTPMIGNHHVTNCLAAATAGLALGIDLVTIATALEKIGQLPGRMEPVGCGQDFNLYVDAAKRPQPIAAALHAAKTHGGGRLHVVASIYSDQTPMERRRLGEILEKMADNVILTNVRSSAKSEIDYEPYHQILDGITKLNRPTIIPNRVTAIEAVLDSAKPNDCVVILGAGESPIASIEPGNWFINDRDVCESWLFDDASRERVATPNQPETFFIDDYRRKKR